MHVGQFSVLYSAELPDSISCDIWLCSSPWHDVWKYRCKLQSLLQIGMMSII